MRNVKHGPAKAIQTNQLLNHLCIAKLYTLEVRLTFYAVE